jgi:hypothetical protein
MAVAVIAGVATPQAAATDDPRPTFVPVTSAERRATRPLAEGVVGAYRSGRFAVLCTLVSPAKVTRVYGSVTHCLQSLRRTPHPCSDRCVFRLAGVFGVYVHGRDKARHAKTVAWVYTIRDPRRSREGEIEIRFRREHGRWTLQPDMVGSWSS